MKVLIIGNGVAGITAARLLRSENSSVEIKIYTEEKYHYYPRPQLIEFLGNRVSLENIFPYPGNWYKENEIEIYLERKVDRIDPENKEVIFFDGEKTNYDRLILASGSSSFIPPINGVDKKGVFVLKKLDDVFAIKDHAELSKRAVVIGGGLLGLESARALKYLGLDVTVIEFNDRLLPRQLDKDGADVLSRQVEKMGIKVILEATVNELSGDENVSGVYLKDGRSFECELVLISAGVRSNVKLAETANIRVNKGIVVNEYLETSLKDIFAIGDVAEFDGQVYGIIPAAIDQAKIVAGNVLGKVYSSYKGTVPSNTLKVVDIDLVSIGIVNPVKSGYEELRLKDKEKGFYKKIILKDNKVVGAILLGSKKGFVSINRLIKEKVDVASIKADLLKEKAVV